MTGNAAREVTWPPALSPAEALLVRLEKLAMGAGLKGARLRRPGLDLYCYEQEYGFAYFVGRHDTKGIERDEALQLIEHSIAAAVSRWSRALLDSTSATTTAGLTGG